MKLTREEYIEQLKRDRPGVVITGNLVTYPSGDKRRIEECDGSCNYHLCTGWVTERLETSSDVR